MNDKEIAEIKRAYSEKRQAVRSVTGYYIAENGEVITKFERSLGLMGEEESEKYLSIFRKTLSGAQHKNLFDFPFSTKDVTDGEAHRRLMALRAGEGFDAEILDGFAGQLAAAFHPESPIVLLFAKNHYDVLRRSKNGSDGEESESSEVYTYFTAALCPVRQTNPALAYNAEEKAFTRFGGINSIAPPEIGFTFPAFDNRQTNIYSALFYTRSTGEAYEEFTNAAFGASLPIVTAKAQDDGFKATLVDALGEELSFAVAKNLHRQIADRIEIHKESRDPEPLVMSQGELRECVEAAGIPAEELSDFAEKYAENLGANAEISPKNVVDPKKFVLKTPDVTIRVAPGKEGLVGTRVINGQKYVLIRAEGGVELNGLNVRIDGEDGMEIPELDENP